MKRDARARSALVRTAKDARLAATERYRDAVAARSRLAVVVAVVARFAERVTSLRRRTAGLPAGRSEIRARLDARRALRASPNALILVRGAVGGSDELSLTLTGPADVCAGVDGIRLAERDLPAVVSASDGTVRLAAVAPADLFTGADLRIEVLAGRTAVPVVVPHTTTLTGRYGKATWPPQLGLGPDRLPTISGQVPASSGVEHEAYLGLTSLTVSWSRPAELVLRAGDAEHAVVGTGIGADGRCTASLDLIELVDRTPPAGASWEASLRSGAGTTPLALPLGEYPALRDLPGTGAIALVRSDGAAATARLRYTATNQLAVRIEVLR